LGGRRGRGRRKRSGRGRRRGEGECGPRLILGRRRGIGIVGRREVAIGKDSGRETETEKERGMESLIGQQPVSK
jgi:hypothetical protein